MFKPESLHDLQKQAQNNTVLEKILLDLHHHIARLAWLMQENIFSFLIGIHTMQGGTVTAIHGVTWKRSTKRLEHTGN